MDFKQNIIAALKKEAKDDVTLEMPPSPELGDYAFPCFVLARVKKKNPVQIAKELAKSLKIKGVSKIEAKGPYLNFFVEKGSRAEQVVAKILQEKDYGSTRAGKGKHALIEHTSINPNASPHVGRARNAIIGDSVARILRYEGYKTDVHYFVNDIGKQIAMLVLAAKGKKPAFNKLLDLYVKFNKQLENSKKLGQDVFAVLKKLEDGDKVTRKKFKDIVDVCVKGQQKIFSDFGIKYDKYDYESDYLFSKKTEDALAKLKDTGHLFTDENDRTVLGLKGVEEVEKGMENAVLVLTRGDGTSLYSLRDIAYTIDKAKWAKGRNIIVLGEDQKLYFHQITAAMELLKVTPPESLHYSFVLLSEGKMSTRKGTVVLLEDFMKEAVQKAKAKISKSEKPPKGKRLDELAKIIGYGAVKYSILKVSAEKNVTFDWEQALSFEGESGPYIQYAHARINSIIKKYKGKKSKPKLSLLSNESEQRLIGTLGRFPDVMASSARQLAPHTLVAYAKDVAQDFTSFYHSSPVLKADTPELVQARLALCEASKKVLKTVLNLLGIDAPDSM